MRPWRAGRRGCVRCAAGSSPRCARGTSRPSSGSRRACPPARGSSGTGRDREPALAARPERPRGGHDRADVVELRRHGLDRHRFAVPALELRLGIERVHLGGAAVHVEEDHVPGAGPVVGGRTARARVASWPPASARSEPKRAAAATARSRRRRGSGSRVGPRRRRGSEVVRGAPAHRRKRNSLVLRTACATSTRSALVASLRREAVDQGQLGGARRAAEGAAPHESRLLVQAFPRFQRELRQRLGAGLHERVVQHRQRLGGHVGARPPAVRRRGRRHVEHGQERVEEVAPDLQVDRAPPIPVQGGPSCRAARGPS